MTERLAYKPAELAEALGCSRAKAYELIASKEIESIKIGKDTRVPIACVQKWMAKQLKASAARER